MALSNISKRNRISLDNICYLVSQEFTVDDIGNEKPISTENLCYCAELPITSSVFYNAGLSGIKLEILLVVDDESYSNQPLIKYGEKTYSINRKYPRDDGMLELYLIAKAGV